MILWFRFSRFGSFVFRFYDFGLTVLYSIFFLFPDSNNSTSLLQFGSFAVLTSLFYSSSFMVRQFFFFFRFHGFNLVISLIQVWRFWFSDFTVLIWWFLYSGFSDFTVSIIRFHGSGLVVLVFGFHGFNLEISLFRFFQFTVPIIQFHVLGLAVLRF